VPNPSTANGDAESLVPAEGYWLSFRHDWGLTQHLLVDRVSAGGGTDDALGGNTGNTLGKNLLCIQCLVDGLMMF